MILLRTLKFLPSIIYGLIAITPASAVRAESIETANIPHVGIEAKNSFHNAYLFAEGFKAFAIAPGGAWSWRSDLDTADQAKLAALADCQKNSHYKCVVFAVNDKVVFDYEQWPTLWRPYPTTEQAQKASVGTHVGQRFYNLQMKKVGKPIRTLLSQLRGKVVILHFWGSWCPTCCGELPSLQRFYDQIKSRSKEMELVLVQVREPIEKSIEWVSKKKMTLPLYDSGYSKKTRSLLPLSRGRQIEDRKLARAFPATYVLDKNGIVVFSHLGAITDWPQYIPFIDDLITQTKNRP